MDHRESYRVIAMMKIYNYLILDRRPHRSIFIEEQIIEKIDKMRVGHSFVAKWTVDDLKSKTMPESDLLIPKDWLKVKRDSFSRTKKWTLVNHPELLL